MGRALPAPEEREIALGYPGNPRDLPLRHLEGEVALPDKIGGISTGLAADIIFSSINIPKIHT